MKNHDKKFLKLPNDGVTRYIILASDKDKTPESYWMFHGYYFAGEFQWAANEEHAFRELERRTQNYPNLNWEIYELLPNR